MFRPKNHHELYLHPRPLGGVSGVASGESAFPTMQNEKSNPFGLLFHFERKTRLELAFKHIDNQTITNTNKVALQM